MGSYVPVHVGHSIGLDWERKEGMKVDRNG